MALLFGLSSANAIATTYYVDINSTNPTPPYTDWSTASTDIQSAVNQTTNGDLVLVNPGVYQTGSDVSSDRVSNRVMVADAITIRSVNGFPATLIDGGKIGRCVYLTNGASISGFTLTDGADFSNGGGIYCVSSNAFVFDCLIISNTAGRGGGGFGGTYSNCIISGNTASNLDFFAGSDGGGVDDGVLNDCTVSANVSQYYGGGVGGVCTMTNCLVDNNVACIGGGVYGGTLFNCTISNNIATNGISLLPEGGGADLANLQGCLVISNSALSRLGGGGGGVCDCLLSNCVIQGNWAVQGGGIMEDSYGGPPGVIANQCSIIGNWAYSAGGGICGPTPGVRSLPPTVTNCVFIGNSSLNGGGACWVELLNCVLTANWATSNGGGVYECLLTGCTLTGNSATNYGGGGFFNEPWTLTYITNCVFSDNSSFQGGGGIASGPPGYGAYAANSVFQFNSSGTGGGSYAAGLDNCLVVSNSAVNSGGGSYNCGVNNCTVIGNFSAGTGGGAAQSRVNNSIVYCNSALSGGANTYYDNLYNCCAIPDSTSTAFDNITNAPLLANPSVSDFQLQSDSPCINSGNNSYVSSAIDLDGNPRIAGGTVDIGAYEYQTPASVISYAYLQQYGLPTDGSVDYADLDGTPFNVYQDWIAGLNPTNSASVLAMLPPTVTNNASGVTVTWQSVGGIVYSVQRSANLVTQPFTNIQSNITGQAGTTSYTDASATNSGPYFYRVAVP